MTHAHNTSGGVRALVLAALSSVLATALVGLGGPAQAESSTAVRAALRSEVVAATNRARERAGCASLQVNAKLTRAAQLHANDMARHERVSHRSSDGTNWPARIRKQGYRKPGAENLAVGMARGARVVRAWLDSPVHRRNIRDCRFKRIGVGFHPEGKYWVQDFGF